MKLCECCFADEQIKQYIINESTEKGLCEYCSESGSLLEIGELLDFFKDFLSIYQEKKEGKPLFSFIQKEWTMFSNETIGKNLLSDILPACNSKITDPECSVEYIDEITDCVDYWGELKDDIKKNRRFIRDLARLEELGWDGLFPKPIEVGSHIELYRARIHESNSQETITPELMGVPPLEKATSGRANPIGIPYLYLSRDHITTLYETRALYLDHISIATFKVKNGFKLNLIDMTGEQDSLVSPFNNDNIPTLIKSRLLMHEISKELSKPLRRNDSEIEYIPTQFICEYIKYIDNADGIMFKSSLNTDGINYVIFNYTNMECVSVEQHQIISFNIQSKKVSYITNQMPSIVSL